MAARNAAESGAGLVLLLGSEDRQCLRQKSVRVAFFCHSGLFRLVFSSHLRIPPQCGWRSDFGSRRSQQMTMLIGQEKQRISERLERLVAEREKLSAHFNELEIAERVLARFEGKAVTTGKVERARPANTAPALGKKHRSQGKRQMPATSLSDAILKAVQAHDEGATASEVLNYLSREFGMAVRPNHLAIALQRHRRAGRLDNRDQGWHLPRSA